MKINIHSSLPEEGKILGWTWYFMAIPSFNIYYCDGELTVGLSWLFWAMLIRIKEGRIVSTCAK